MPPLDVLIHPGGQGTRPLMRNPQHLAWVRPQAATVPLMTSVCTGALVYAAAGLLAGRPATTHWESLDLLRELDPSIEVNPDARYVDDGTSSPAPASAPASTWPCTWSPASRTSTGPARSAAPSSTTPTHRPSTTKGSRPMSGPAFLAYWPPSRCPPGSGLIRTCTGSVDTVPTRGTNREEG